MRNIYAVYDVVAQAMVGQLMLFNRDEPAVRIFTDALQDKALILGQHPADYELVRIGMIFEGDIPDLVAETLTFPMVEPHDKHGITLHGNPKGEPRMITIISGKQWLAMQEKNAGA